MNLCHSCKVIQIYIFFYGCRAGLLFQNSHRPGGLYYRPAQKNVDFPTFRETRETPSHNSEDFGIKIGKIKQAVLSNVSANSHADNRKEIKLALHLGKNSSYETNDNTTFRTYNYKNVLPNFLLRKINFSEKINNSIYHVHNHENTSLINMTDMKILQMPYRFATTVLLHQHDPIGYLMRDCFKYQAHTHGLLTSYLSINSHNRRQWDTMGLHKKEKFQALHGSLSFGVCEEMQHSCSYFAIVPHPLDRILKVFHTCQKNKSDPVCHFSNTNSTSTDLRSFIHSQGNSLFQKLLYHSLHCKLIEDDEVCLEDLKSTFIVSPAERTAYLKYIIQHLEEWFSVIGLVDRFQDSLTLVDFLHGLDVSQCVRQQMDIGAYPSAVDDMHDVLIEGMPYYQLKKHLLNDPFVQKTLAADLTIYDKLNEIFDKQWLNYLLWKQELPTVKPHVPTRGFKQDEFVTNGNPRDIQFLKERLYDVSKIQTYSNKNNVPHSTNLTISPDKYRGYPFFASRHIQINNKETIYNHKKHYLRKRSIN